MKVLLFGLTLVTNINPIAVEYLLDPPLGPPEKWKFAQFDRYFIQHRCSQPGLKKFVENLENGRTNIAEQLGAFETKEPLQIRLYANAADYRRSLSFSRARDGHYNALHNILASYCSVDHDDLEQQLILYEVSGLPLRTWQRTFIAEVLPALRRQKTDGAFSDAAKDKPIALQMLLLSNYTPRGPERATMRRLTLYLSHNNQLMPFVRELLRQADSGNTGITALETLFETDINTLAVAIDAVQKK